MAFPKVDILPSCHDCISHAKTFAIITLVCNALITTGGVDYVSGPFSVTIPAGQANISFDVPITDDNIYEQNEKFKLAIDRSSTPDGVRIGNPRKVTVVIGDNDNCKCK